MPEPLHLIAFYTGAEPPLRVVPSSRWREWMNLTDERSANRCLPLLMANESGWVLLNPAAFTATWAGSDHPGAVTIEYDRPWNGKGKATSHFGYGIITFGVPYLFRTPPGINLLARGPANLPKDGAAPLEGLVETDWSVATFTMNWKLTRANHPVRFEKDEPFCMVVPQRRDGLESFVPEFRDLRTDPETYEGTRQWNEGREYMERNRFLAEHSREYAEWWSAWQKHYFRGKYPDGSPAPEHQTKRRLREFD